MPSLSLSPSLWETVKCDFKSLFPEDVFQMWFEPVVCLESTGDTMTLGVANDFAAIWIHDNYLDLITQRLRDFVLEIRIGVNDVPAHGHEGVIRSGNKLKTTICKNINLCVRIYVLTKGSQH